MIWFKHFFLNIGTSGECIHVNFLSPAKRLMQTPACLQINTFGVFHCKNDFLSTDCLYPPNYNYGDSFQNIVIHIHHINVQKAVRYCLRKVITSASLSKIINKCIAYYDYLNLIDIHRHFSSKVKHTNGHYSLCRPLWCRSLWTGAIYDVRNCSVSATGERDRSRIQVQFKIKCFNISKN